MVVVLVNAIGGQSCCHKRRQTEDQESKKCRKPVHRPHGGGESDAGAGSPLGSCNETVPSQRVAVISLCPVFHLAPVQPGPASAVSVCTSVRPNTTSRGSSLGIHLCCRAGGRQNAAAVL